MLQHALRNQNTISLGEGETDRKGHLRPSYIKRNVLVKLKGLMTHNTAESVSIKRKIDERWLTNDTNMDFSILHLSQCSVFRKQNSVFSDAAILIKSNLFRQTRKLLDIASFIVCFCSINKNSSKWRHIRTVASLCATQSYGFISQWISIFEQISSMNDSITRLGGGWVWIRILVLLLRNK